MTTILDSENGNGNVYRRMDLILYFCRYKPETETWSTNWEMSYFYFAIDSLSISIINTFQFHIFINTMHHKYLTTGKVLDYFTLSNHWSFVYQTLDFISVIFKFNFCWKSFLKPEFETILKMTLKKERLSYQSSSVACYWLKHAYIQLIIHKSLQPKRTFHVGWQKKKGRKEL